MSLIVETTADGSSTLYVPEMEEHYHSVKGALTESRHIFIDCGLKHHSGTSLRVLEIGFGTGLNTLLTALQCTVEVQYFTLELYPLPMEVVNATGYAALLDSYPQAAEVYNKLHSSPWNEEVKITENFSLHKLNVDFTNPATILPQNIDVVYFDAFAPEKQPEMWSETVISKVFDAMNSGGILTTYCAKGVIRRRLADAGFLVERLAGPPGGKREILRATKP